jgi:flagellar hook-length control protein FliK
LPLLDAQSGAAAEAQYSLDNGAALLRTRKSETTAPLQLALPAGTSNDAAASAAARTSDIARTVAVPVHDARWPEAVAAQVRWALADGVQSATLKLVPEHLGPLEVRIELKDNQINLNFGATQAETRQALEDSLPRLREALAGAGLALGQASVRQDSRPASHPSDGPRPAVREPDADEAISSARILLGLVDEYA